MNAIEDRLAYPFKKRISPHVNDLEKEVEKWIFRDYRFENIAQVEQLKKIRAGEFAGSCFPDSSLEKLIPMARFILWGFVYDDTYGPLSFADLHATCNRTMEIARGASITAADSPIQVQLAVVVKELQPFVSSLWMDRFLRHVGIFFEGMLEDSYYSYRPNLTYPPLNTFIDVREKLMGGGNLCDLTEVSLNILLPDVVYCHPVIQRIRRVAGYMMSWANDLYSAEKEFRDNEAMNLVLVIRNEQQCSFTAAMEAAALLHDTHLEEFLYLISNLPDFGSNNELVANYVNGLKSMLRGHVAWLASSERYQHARS